MVGGGAHSCERTNGGVCVTINADVVLGITPRTNQSATGSQVWHQSNTTAASFAGPCFADFMDRHIVPALGLCAKELVEGVVSPPSEVAVRGAAELRAAHEVADAKFWLQHHSVLHRETSEQEAWRGGGNTKGLRSHLNSSVLRLSPSKKPRHMECMLKTIVRQRLLNEAMCCRTRLRPV